jgi:hypothetical protein
MLPSFFTSTTISLMMCAESAVEMIKPSLTVERNAKRKRFCVVFCVFSRFLPSLQAMQNAKRRLICVDLRFLKTQNANHFDLRFAFWGKRKRHLCFVLHFPLRFLQGRRKAEHKTQIYLLCTDATYVKI